MKISHYIYLKLKYKKYLKRDKSCKEKTENILEYEECMGRGQLRRKLIEMKIKNIKMKKENGYMLIQVFPTVKIIDNGEDMEIDLSTLPDEIKNKSEEEIKVYVLENINDFPEYEEVVNKIKERIITNNELDVNIVIDIEDYNLEIIG